MRIPVVIAMVLLSSSLAAQEAKPPLTAEAVEKELVEYSKKVSVFLDSMRAEMRKQDERHEERLKKLEAQIAAMDAVVKKHDGALGYLLQPVLGRPIVAGFVHACGRADVATCANQICNTAGFPKGGNVMSATPAPDNRFVNVTGVACNH